MVAASKAWASFVTTLALVGTFLHLVSSYNLQALAFDGSQYIEFSDDIISGAAFTLKPVSEMAFGTIMRTPIYPLLLSLGRCIFPNSLHAALLTCHFLLAGLSIFLLIRSSKSFSGSCFSIFAFAIASYRMGELFMAVATEWAAFCALIMVLALTMRFLEQQTIKRLLALTLLCSLLPLLRPALWFMLIVPVSLVVVSKNMRARFVSTAVLVAIAPTLFWIGINKVRIGEATLSPVGNFSLFATASLIGDAIQPIQNDALLETFRVRLNQRKTKFTPDEIVAANSIPRTYNIQPKYDQNMFAAWEIGSEMGLDSVAIGRIERGYAVRSISENFALYLLQVKTAAYSLLFSLPIFVPGLAIPLIWLRSARNHEIAVAALLACAIHALQVVTSSLFFPLDPRFYTLTLSSCLFMATLVAFKFVSEHFSVLRS